RRSPAAPASRDRTPERRTCAGRRRRSTTRPSCRWPRGSCSTWPSLGPLDCLVLLHVEAADDTQEPGDMLLLLVDDALDVLLGVLVGEREGLLLVAVDGQELVGQVLAQRLEVGVELGQAHARILRRQPLDVAGLASCTTASSSRRAALFTRCGGSVAPGESASCAGCTRGRRAWRRTGRRAEH